MGSGLHGYCMLQSLQEQPIDSEVPVTTTVRHLEDIKLTQQLKKRLREIVDTVDNLPEGEKRQLFEMLKEWQYGNKRVHPRKSCSVPVDYAAEGRAFKGSIKNVSVNGLFIETRQKFVPGETITLTFSLPNYSKPLKTHAKVVWCSPQGVGVEFNLPNKYLEEFWKAKIETL